MDSETHVRSVDEMASATRIYCTYKALSHDKVSILYGGLITCAETPK